MKCKLCRKEHKYQKENKFEVKLRSNGTGGYINLPPCLIGKIVKVVIINETRT